MIRSMTSLSEVTTCEGVVRGTREGKFLRWRSIPYAAPPTGDLRFRAPAPVTPWTGVRDATEFGFAAIQNRKGSQTGARVYQPQSEDCLTINVTAPATPSDKPRAVMVFIHGGGYLFGTSAVELYSGKSLVSRGDVIVVSFNYRLGLFGYVDFSQFSTPERPFDSNLGLRDQVAALEWVQRNIAAFGGDPGNVTIFGESAGAAAVTTLFATPAAHGLFHRGIAESSPADWATTKEAADDLALRCVKAMGATPETAATVLSTTDPGDMRRAAGKIVYRLMQDQPGQFAMIPVVDGDFLPKHPLEAYADGSANPVPLIIGTNRDEGTLFSKFADHLPTNPQRITRMLGRANIASPQAITAAYPGYPAKNAAVKLGGDYIFWRPSIEVCAAHSAHAPTYNYRYDFAPRVMTRMGLGATHASELFAVFGFGDTRAGLALTALGGRKGLREVTQELQGHWLSFAKTGAPRESWPTYDTETRKTLVFDARTRVVSDLNKQRRLAWSGYRTAPGAGVDITEQVAG